MPVYTDQAGRQMVIISARRIISIVPSQTELLYDLGLEEEVIGITKFCVHPEKWFQTKPRVGGTKEIDINKIMELKPDLIIANKEENVKEQIEILSKKCPVWISDVNNLETACEMISRIGTIVKREIAARELVIEIQSRFLQLETVGNKQTAVYLIWKDPYMTVGGDTFISSMMEKAGLQNMFAGEKRYPKISLEQLKEINPELILLSSEPYPFKQKHIDEFQQAGINAKIILVDGEMFSWYGSHLLKAPSYFNSLKMIL